VSTPGVRRRIDIQYIPIITISFGMKNYDFGK